MSRYFPHDKLLAKRSISNDWQNTNAANVNIQAAANFDTNEYLM